MGQETHGSIGRVFSPARCLVFRGEHASSGSATRSGTADGFWCGGRTPKSEGTAKYTFSSVSSPYTSNATYRARTKSEEGAGKRPSTGRYIVTMDHKRDGWLVEPTMAASQLPSAGEAACTWAPRHRMLTMHTAQGRSRFSIGTIA